MIFTLMQTDCLLTLVYYINTTWLAWSMLTGKSGTLFAHADKLYNPYFVLGLMLWIFILK